MIRRRIFHAATRVTPIGALLLGSCTLLSREVTLTQCEVDADCAQRGSAFEGTVCEARLCVTPSGTGGTNGGMGGNGPEPVCVTNGDCIDKNLGTPSICRANTCIRLTDGNECPVVLGAGKDNKYLADTNPIIFGAYSKINTGNPILSPPTLNYKLAIEEVNRVTGGGIQLKAGEPPRPFIAVVCNGADNPDLDKSLGHLIDTLEVPAIISSLYESDLRKAFTTRGQAAGAFFLSPLVAASTLTTIDDDGLLWHMVGAGPDLAPAYLPLLTGTEALVRNQRGMLDEQPIRVALVDARDQFMEDLADRLVATISFNGKSAVENGLDFRRIRIDSSLAVADPDVAPAITSLKEFQPHIILGIATQEFPVIVDTLEATWQPGWADCPSGRCPPFYLTGPAQFEDSTLSGLSTVRSRLLGINFAGAEDPTLYNNYLDKLIAENQGLDFSLAGSENFYDTAYFLMYSIAASGSPSQLTGREVAEGMTRLITGKTVYSVGTMDMVEALGVLTGSTSSKISLLGTMGPPDFTLSTGARKSLPSMYCMRADGSYVQDALRFDPETGELVGEQTCQPDFQP